MRIIIFWKLKLQLLFKKILVRSNKKLSSKMSLINQKGKSEDLTVNKSVNDTQVEKRLESQKSNLRMSVRIMPSITGRVSSTGRGVILERLETVSSKILPSLDSMSKQDDLLNRPDYQKNRKKKGKKKQDSRTEDSLINTFSSSVVRASSVSFKEERNKSKEFTTEDELEYDSDEEELATNRTRSYVKKKKKRDIIERKEGSGLVRDQKSKLSMDTKKKKTKSSRSLITEESKQTIDAVDDGRAAVLDRIRAATMRQLIVDGHGEKSKETDHSIPTRSTEKPIKKAKKSGKIEKPKGKMKKAISSVQLQELEAAARMEQLQKIREAERLQREGEEKQKREIAEQQLREEQLSKTLETIENIVCYNKELLKNERKEIEWQLYIDCGKLPDPSLCDQMTRYLHLWALDMENNSVEKASGRTYDVIKLLCDLEDLLDVEIDQKEHIIQNSKWLYKSLKEFQNLSLNVATYKLLKYVEKNLNRVDIPTADFNFHDDYMDLNIWLRINLPTPLPNPRRPPKPRIFVTFESPNIELIFPTTVDGENMALRVMYLKYDHLSEQSESFNLPSNSIRMDLLKATKDEWRRKLFYKYSESLRKNQEEIQNFRSDEEIPIVPYTILDVTPSEHCLEKDYEGFFEYIKDFLMPTTPNLLNLRKYTIIGGVYHIDLLYQPPQPQEYVTLDLNLAVFYLPKEMEYVPFFVNYYQSTNSVNTIQEPLETTETADPENLLQVKMSWPTDVVFLQSPILCHWDQKNRNWTTNHIHNVTYDTENKTVSFRSEVFGIYAFATSRYSHLPYKDWRMKPDNEDSVTITIVSNVLELEFNVKNDTISLVAIKNCPVDILGGIIGKYFKLNRLKRLMNQAGVDVFPEADASCYVTNTSEKHEPMETHLYYNMAMISNSFKFARSKWNAGSGRRNIILRIREFCPAIDKVQKVYSTLHVTPLKSSLTDCTESMVTFPDVEIENIKFSSDLYNLMKVSSGIAIRNKVLTGEKDTIYTVAQLLISTRLLSFS